MNDGDRKVYSYMARRTNRHFVVCCCIAMADFQFQQCVYEDERTVSERMCLFVIDVAKQAVSRSGVFSVGLSGGFFRLSLLFKHLR